MTDQTAKQTPDARRKDNWDKARISAGIFARILTPVAVAVVGYWIQLSLAERETNARLLELAVGILREAPEEQTIDLRAWAADLIDASSKVTLPESVKEQLRTSALSVYQQSECNDGLDNDGNDLIDFPADPGCFFRGDPREAPLPPLPKRAP